MNKLELTMLEPSLAALSFVLKYFKTHDAGYFVNYDLMICSFALSRKHDRAFATAYKILAVVMNMSNTEKHRNYWRHVMAEVSLIEDSRIMMVEDIIEYSRIIFSLEVEHRIMFAEHRERKRSKKLIK